jgi:tetratricopeptide (TPR) repeat protein
MSPKLVTIEVAMEAANDYFGDPGGKKRMLRLLNIALLFQEAGEYQQSVDTLRTVSKRHPENPQAFLLLGLAYRELGQLEQAEAALRQAIELDPDLPQAVQSLGLMLASQGRSAEAVQLLKPLIEKEPGDVVALRALASELTRLDRRDEAMGVLEQAWRRSQEAEVGIVYGRYLIRVGQWTAAEQVLAAAAESDPKPETLVEWAYALVLLNRCDEALEVLQRIVQEMPDFGRAWRGISTCQLNLRRPEKALAAAERALSIEPQHCRNWLAKANALWRLGRFEEVVTAAQTGIEGVPADDEESLPVLQELTLRSVDAWLAQGRTEDALERLQQLRQRFPDSERLLTRQVSLLNDCDRPAEALAALDAAQQADPSLDVRLAPLRYVALHLLGQGEAAWELVEPLLAEDSDKRIVTLIDLALSLYSRGRNKEALAIFLQLRPVTAHPAQLDCNIGFLLVGQGELEAAEERFRQVLADTSASHVHLLAWLNLAYLYLLRGDLEQAERALQQATAEQAADEEAFVRVAFWHDGQIQPDFFSQPARWLPLLAAAQANRVTLAMAQAKLDVAEEIARGMIAADMAPWGWQMLGWALLAQDDAVGARQAWEHALQSAPTQRERTVVQQWLEGVKRET